MRLYGVSYRYGRRGRWVLRDVELELPAGGTVVVLGSNGVGKSTLLQLAAGVLRPSRGSVHDRPGPVGWVPERFPADQPFTVTGYLVAMARMHAATGRVDHWIDRLGLTPYRHTRLADLSKGTAQKVGLAQAMIPDPRLLVLDEPWEGLDANARALVPDIVAEVTGKSGIVLVSDHRGETGRLPGAVTWTVAGGTVTPGEAGAPTAIIEIAVPADVAEGTAAALRAAGHDVVAVRNATTKAAV